MLWTLLIGLVIGALAKWLMPGRDPGGILMTMFAYPMIAESQDIMPG
jgi:uncharacterized membrane protein YeaQ/YmgE (transglycosylase-associated protein family)